MFNKPFFFTKILIHSDGTNSDICNSDSSKAQTEQQKEILLGVHILLSEYFQSCDMKQRYDKATDELLCRNLLSWFSGQTKDKYHGNPPNSMVIRRISW